MQWQKQQNNMSFTNVTYKENMGRNPAQVDRRTGDLFVNPQLWNAMPESFRRFILLHEEGHLKGGPNGTPTADEAAADLYAFRQYKNTEPNSLKNSVIALDTLLGHSPEQIKRKLLIYSAALLEDWQHNRNAKALVEYHNIKAELEQYHHVKGLLDTNSNQSNWIGAAISGIMSLVGYGMKAKQDGEIEKTVEEQEAYNLGRAYELFKNNSDKQESKMFKSVEVKYTLIIVAILSITGLIIYKITKK
jgi:hypothetical protein